ncbi:MAG: ExeM/NucH family extracellular endonuclease, partial [Chloroflexi bacterium]|nr:ExeM/NucH family extracellular endonuclease [Chloroflexota bacterium]
CIACTPGATGTITWSLGTVTPTTPASFVIMTLISDSVPFATTLTNTVTITTTSAELDTDNNDAQWPVSISALDLIVSKSGPQYAIIGDSLVYTIDIDNQGAVTATNVLVTDTLPISVTYVSDDSGWACPACTLGASGTLTWTAGNVPSNTLHFFNLTATVDISAASGLVLTNWVTATTDTVGDQSDNNASSVNTAVYPLVPITTVQFVSNPGNDNDSPLAGQIVWVEGVVTSEPGEIDNPTRFMVIQDPAGGPWSGLPLFRSANFGSAPEGTIVRALGTVQESYGLTQLQMSSDPWALQTIGSTAVPAPAPLLTADYDDSDPDISEQWEGVYLEFAQTPITVTDDSLGYGEWHFDDGSGNARADDLGNRDNNLTYVPVNGDIYTFIRGIGLYSFGNYKLEPRYDADVAIKMTAPELSKSAPYLVLPGSLYTYTLTLNNQIGISLTNVLITDAVPANTTLAYILDGGTESNGIISWTASSLPDQGTIVARFAVTATNGVATAVNDNYAAVSTNYTPTTTGPPVTTYIGDRLHIYHVQGDDFVSPIVGADVTIDGVVVADFQDTTTGMAGFFFQDAAGDGNPATSDGIFVYDDGFGVDVTVGDLVTVTGTVAEFNAQTEINNVTAVTPTTTGATITPTVIVLPETVNGELEQYEGMAVTIPQVMTATQNYFQGRYGQVSMAAGGRLFQPTNIYTPTSAAAIALADENARRMLILDDGQDISPFGDNPNPIPYIGINNTLRAGDTVSGLTGVLDEGRINSSTPPNLDYRLQPTAPVTFTRVNTRSLVHDDVGGNLKVASFNVLNYFTTIDTGAAICGPNMNLGCRGADSAAEFVRQRTKIITAVLDIDADVMGLMEIENNAITATADLVDGLNTIAGAGTYAFIDSGTIGLDAIKVALIYQPANVTPVGITAVLTDVAPFNINTRPPLAQTFMDNASGEQFLVVVNHFKSKGSSCADLGDPNTGDGQGNCNLTRVLAANELTNWLNTDPTATGVTDILIIGDLNSYAQEDPIVTLESAGYTDLIEAFNSAWQYTYVFDGQLGYLDHAMANGSMTAQITGVTQWHINADEPSVIDYNVENKPQDLYSPTAYRASDHDPVIV